MKLRVLLAGLAVCLATTSLAACGSDESTSEDVTIRVYAAASLTDSFTELGKQFEEDHPGTKVRVQLRSAAPGSPSRSAAVRRPTCSPPRARATWTRSCRTRTPRTRRTSRSNSMEIAVPPDNPGKVAGVADLAKPGVKVALCQAQVPCGKVAAEVFENAGITVKPVTEEVDVKSVLTKVTLGEVDAGVVYVTDVLASGEKVKGVEIPADQNARTTYPIATLTGSEHTKTADEFVGLVLSTDGAKVLEAAGFQKP